MNEPIIFKMPSLPKMLGELSHSNQFLKMFSLVALLLSILTLSLLIVLVSKAPLVLTLASTGEKLEKVELPKAEVQIKEGVRAYLEKRYQWQPENVKQKLLAAQAFVLPTSIKAYQGAVANVSKFSTERLVTQRLYAEKIEVSLEKKSVFITGDRVTSIQGMKAVGNLRLELSFESGPRTRENPWGIYITKEREEI